MRTPRQRTDYPYRAILALLVISVFALSVLTSCLGKGGRTNESMQADASSSQVQGETNDVTDLVPVPVDTEQQAEAEAEPESYDQERLGIDVSELQGEIDWEAVAADGVSFAFLRIGGRGTTEGGLYHDELFRHNLRAAHAAGIECGAYFFSQAMTVEEAREEAQFVLQLLDGCTLEYPVAFDYETLEDTRIADVDIETATSCARTFCDAMTSAGYKAMIYGNDYDLMHLDLSKLSDLSIWLAHYSDDPTSDLPYSILQYTAKGSIDGIDTIVDLNTDLGTWR